MATPPWSTTLPRPATIRGSRHGEPLRPTQSENPIETPPSAHEGLRSGREKLSALTDSILHKPSLHGGHFGVLARIIHWQIGKFLRARRALVRVGPIRFYCYPDSASASSALYFGLPEWDEMLFVLRYLRDGDRLVDVGANVGLYSLLAASLGPSLRVTAFEPARDAADRLRENLALNGFAGVTVTEAALGAHSGSVRFTRGLDTLNRFAEPSDVEGIDIPVTTLDASPVDGTPTLIKIDVEGYELDVLRGADATLRRHAPAILFEFIATRESRRSAEELFDFLADHGYRTYEYRAGDGSLQPFELGQTPQSGNLVATPDVETVQRRLRSSPFQLKNWARVECHLEWP